MGKTKPVPHEALKELFSLVSSDTKCVVLNACYSHVQAQAISQHIDYVIGMKHAISDSAAIAFAVGFYQALGGGRTIVDAFAFGKVQIMLHEGTGEKETPILHISSGIS